MTMVLDRQQLEDSICVSCKYLFLSSAVTDFCRSDATPEQLAFLDQVLRSEVSQREETKHGRLIRKAHFPVYKTFEGYELKNVKLPPLLTKDDLFNVSFVDKKENLIFYGPVGLGKTHLGIAIGVAACNKGKKVGFHTVTGLVLKLAEARKKGRLDKLYKQLVDLDLLILDEWGYVPVDRDGSTLLYKVISSMYENKSLLLTTNLEFSRWGSIFTDTLMAGAMIDRLVHYGHLVIFEGTSYRMEHALMKQTARQQ